MGGDLDLPELLRGAIMHEVRTPTMVDPESDTGKKTWRKVVSLVQAAFCYGTWAEYLSWQMVVLIQKCGGDFQG